VDDSRELVGMTLMLLGKDKNSRDAKDLAAAKAKLDSLRPNIKLFNGDSPKTELLSGEVVAGVVWNGEAALAARENPKIQYVLPEDGCGIWYDNLAVPKGAPHPDAALAFINFTLDGDMSQLISRDFPYSNPNKAGLAAFSTHYPDLFKQYTGSITTNPPEWVFTRCQPTRDVGDALPLWDQTWTEFKSGRN
jgi:spermidine/putrescine-binding protein